MNIIPTTLGCMLERMYSLAVHDNYGKQYLPIFDYAWERIETYVPAEEAIVRNTSAWLNEHTLTCNCDDCRKIARLRPVPILAQHQAGDSR